jgi:hypothetical protein
MVYMMKRNEVNHPAIEVGDLIKGFDFEPCPGRPDMYVVGIVEWIGMREPEGYLAYQIRTVYDSYDKCSTNKCATSRVGKVVYVPVQTSMDYDGRVTKV